jgi:hypothetical protein
MFNRKVNCMEAKFQGKPSTISDIKSQAETQTVVSVHRSKPNISIWGL